MRNLARHLAALAAALALLCLTPVGAQQGPTTIKLLTAAAATGAQAQWPGGTGTFTVVGTWNGATVTLQYVGPDGSTLVNVGTNCVLTSASAPANCLFYLPRGLVQATVSGAGGSTSLTATANVLPVLVQ